MGSSDVAIAARLHADAVAPEPAEPGDGLGRDERIGIRKRVQAIAVPARFAIRGVEAPERAREAQDEFLSPAEVGEHAGIPRTDVAGAGVAGALGLVRRR